jgi:acetolactate synthase-1/3 small subunit
LSVTVEDQPGVLAKVASMCAMRGFNIHSLAVGPIHQPGLSRITLVVDDVDVEQISKQLNKLVNVLKITELDPADSLEREVMLVRIAADPGSRRELRDTAEVYGATTVDIGANTITFAVSGHPDRLADFLGLVGHYGVVDLVKSGRIAMARDTKMQPKAAFASGRGR